MKKEQLSEHIGNIDDRLVQQAEHVPNYARQHRQNGFKRFAAIAAVIALMVCSFTVGAVAFAKETIVEVPIEGEESGDDNTPTEPVDPGEGEEEEGGDDDTPTTDGPSIVSDYLTSGISYTIKQNPDWDGDGLDDKYIVVDSPSSANVTISAPKGFKSILVRIDTQNTAFATAAGIMGLTSNVDILDPDLDSTLAGLLNPPTSGATTYTLNLATFFPMMAMYGPDVHNFIITVTDNEDNPVGPVTLKVTITEE